MMPQFEFHEMARLSGRSFSDLKKKQICFPFPVKVNCEKDWF